MGLVPIYMRNSLQSLYSLWETKGVLLTLVAALGDFSELSLRFWTGLWLTDRTI